MRAMITGRSGAQYGAHMSNLSRRKLITTGLAADGGRVGPGRGRASRATYGLIPPDHGGIYGPGETLTYAAQRLLTRHSLAREFPRSQISKPPFANEIAPPSEAFKRLQAGGFADWRLAVDGMVARPHRFRLPHSRAIPPAARSRIWPAKRAGRISRSGSACLSPTSWKLVGILPQARYVVYFSIEPDWWDSIDMADALHPQTLLAYGMNGGELPVGNGGPLRLRVPRQLGYKSVKFITRLTVTDSLKRFGKGLGSASPEGGYAWYAGI